jgi:molybdopterin synthase sulfur carrier subunit
MNATVKILSPLKELAGTGACSVELAEGATISGLLAALREPFPDLFPAAERAMYMVNHKIVTRETVLNDGDQVMLLQPLGGG